MYRGVCCCSHSRHHEEDRQAAAGRARLLDAGGADQGLHEGEPGAQAREHGPLLRAGHDAQVGLVTRDT